MLLSLVKGLSSVQRCTITCARLTKSGIRHLRPAWPRPRTHTRVLLGVRVFRRFTLAALSMGASSVESARQAVLPALSGVF